MECPVSGDGDPCDNHGKCVLNSDGTSASCTCDKGYYGSTCESSCPGLVVTSDSVLECSGRGTCNPETLECTCEEGVKNQETCSMEECSADTCIHGTCVNGVCQCNTNYYGATCATFCDMHTTCNDHGVCSETDGECLCLYGWVDTSCDVPCTASANCSDHGVCDSFGDCLCYDGYDGDLCEEHNVGYSFLAVLLLLGNGVVGYLWYRSRVGSLEGLHG